MRSVLNEIARLRKGKPISVDRRNSNRYRLVVQEDNGSKTAYYFSTPIYNNKTRKMVDVKFSSNGGTVYTTGSNANITISRNILMENSEGSCAIELPQKPTFISSTQVSCGGTVLIPTTNGVAMKCNVKGKEGLSFVIEVSRPFLKIRRNNKYFALMKARFSPFVVISCIGALDATGNIIAPAKLEYQKLTDRKFRITVSATSPLAQYVLLECNLYEKKLFQDTTVESMNPSTNNAFGSAAFIGNTSVYGEQWLYSKLDYSRLTEIMDKRIQKAVLHMPKLNRSKVDISAFRVVARFCSFGSNWNNKIPGGAPVSDSSSNAGYQSIDITSLLVEQRTGTIRKSDGLILKSKVKGSGFSAIATGDSYLAPQILEINFR